MTMNDGYSLVQECTSSYAVQDRPDGGIEILIVVPARFAELWMVKLSELRATDEEISNAAHRG